MSEEFPSSDQNFAAGADAHSLSSQDKTDGSAPQILNVADLKLKKHDFIMQRTDRFLDTYAIGLLIGKGTLGEVRIC